VRRTLMQMKQDALEGIMPDDPVDRLAVELMLQEDARLKNAE